MDGTLKRMRSANAGFTLLEVILAAALGALLIALVYTPFVNGMIMVQRESTEMNMFRSADALMTRLSSLLQPAVLPVPPGAVTADAADKTSFHDIARSRSRGFGTNGGAWRDVLQAGTDFVPFCTPVFFEDTESTVDSSGLPVLGVVMPDGTTADSGANYIWSNSTPQERERKFVLDGNIHPALSAVAPSAFGIAATETTVNPDGARFAQRLAFPGGSAQGYGVIRFVPDRENGSPALVNEADFNQDLNQDGTNDDVFTRGSLRMEYANDGSGPIQGVQTLFPLTGQSVLLQLNREDPGYVPLFQLVGGFNGGNSPAGLNWNQAARGGSYVLLVRLLLFDQETQRGSVLATGVHGGRQYLTRQYQSFIELRNMTIE